MRRRHSPWNVVAAIAGVAIAVGAAFTGTTVVSAAIGGDVGAPDTTIPLLARPEASQPNSRIAVVGDIGTGAPDAFAVADRVASTGNSDPFDALVVLGDNVYPDGDASRLGATLFEPYGPVLAAGADLLPVLGNHDTGFADEQVAALGMPGRWYSAEIGDVLFVGLDSTMAEDPAQHAWLDATLAASDSKWAVAALHHPPFSAGVHGSDEESREAFVPLFEWHGVDLVLAGHEHDYQRTLPIGGITYVISGAGAKVRATGQADFTAYSSAVLHFVELAVWDDRIEVSAISLDGVFDHTTITPHMPQMLSADAIPIGGFLAGETASGIRLTGLAIGVWAVVTLVSRLMPAALAVRAERVLAVASTMSVLALLGGVVLVAVSFAI